MTVTFLIESLTSLDHHLRSRCLHAQVDAAQDRNFLQQCAVWNQNLAGAGRRVYVHKAH